METIIKLQLPLKRWPRHRETEKYLPRWRRWLMPILDWGGCSIAEFGGSRVNKVRHYAIFRRCILTIHRNEYYDKSDAERADEYLTRWSEAETELRMFRAKVLGEDMAPEVKKVIREAFGVDFDEGTFL